MFLKEKRQDGWVWPGLSTNGETLVSFTPSIDLKTSAISAEEASGVTLAAFRRVILSISLQNSRGLFFNKTRDSLKKFDFATAISLRTMDRALLYRL